VYGGGPPNGPFLYADQDIVNAILASRCSPEVIALEHRFAPHPPFRELVVVDEQGLRCRYPDGSEPYVLHHVLAKPWLTYTRTNAYCRLLRRLLLGADVELRLHPDQVPLRLRAGKLAGVARLHADTRASLWAQRGRLGLRRGARHLVRHGSRAADDDPALSAQPIRL